MANETISEAYFYGWDCLDHGWPRGFWNDNDKNWLRGLWDDDDAENQAGAALPEAVLDAVPEAMPEAVPEVLSTPVRRSQRATAGVPLARYYEGEYLVKVW